MLRTIRNGQTSVVLRVKILNSSVSTGAGLTGLTSASSGLIISTITVNEAAATAYTVAGSTIEGITTLGTYAAPTATKCRFKEVDATNHKGLYELHFADARFAVANARSIVVSLSGATNMAEADFVVQLQADDPNVAKPANFDLMSIDANGRLDVIKVAGTTQTARDIGASVLLSAGTGTGQIDFTAGVPKANVTQLLGTAWLTPVVAGTPDVNAKRWNNLTTVALPLVPTVAGRTLDVSATGEGGIDWGNIGSPTEPANLTQTQILSVSGDVAGNVVGSIFGYVASVLGNVGGNVVGSVASVVAGVNTTQLAGQTVTAAAGVTFPSSVASPTNITAGTITTATNLTTNNDKTGYGLSAGAVQAIWDALTSALTTAGSIGKKLSDWVIGTAQTGDSFARIGAAGAGLTALGDTRIANLDATVSSRSTYAGGAVDSVTGNVGGNVVGSVASVAAGGISAASFAAGAIDAAAIAADAIGASELAASAVDEIVDAVWDELLSGHAIAGSTGLTLFKADTTLELAPGSPGEYRFTVDALELAPAGTGGGGGGPSADAIADAVWAEALPGAYGAGSAGKLVGDNLNATVGSRATQASVDAVDDLLDTEMPALTTSVAAVKAKTDNLPPDPADASDIAASLATITGYIDTEVAATLAAVDTEVAAIKAKTDNLPATPAATGDIPTALQNADALLNRDMSAVSDTNARTPLMALRFIRNKWSIAGTTLTVTKEDDTATAWTAVVTATPGADPITANDPVG